MTTQADRADVADGGGELRGWLVDNTLLRSDLMSMAASVELRVPFLDYRLVELAARVPARFKVRPRNQKAILKDALADRLPIAVSRRAKIGFPTPLAALLRGPWGCSAKDVLLQPSSTTALLFDRSRVARLVNKHKPEATVKPDPVPAPDAGTLGALDARASARMKILFLSSLYATPLLPDRSPGNARLIHAMRRHPEIKVIAPVPCIRRSWCATSPPCGAWPKRRPRSPTTTAAWCYTHAPCTCPSRGEGSTQVCLHFPPSRPSGGVRRFAPDVLLSAWAYPDGTAAVMLGRLLGLPCVVRTMGSDINDQAKRPGRRGQIAWAMKRAARVIALGRALGQELERLGVDEGKIAVIPTGVDRARFFPQDRRGARAHLGMQGKTILVPGRLSPEKGCDVFIEAFMALSRDADVRAVLVGDGPERTKLEARVAALGLADRVRFDGFRPKRGCLFIIRRPTSCACPAMKRAGPTC